MKNFLKFSSALAVLAGLILIAGGAWGICFTYKNISAENIITPSDARIPGVVVRGPLTLKAQADIIREHTLRMTGGKTFAEMPRVIPKIDEEGQPVLDDEGNPVMTPNTSRDIWITATALITALHLGILTYVFSGLALLLGLISIWTGVVFCFLSRKYQIGNLPN